MITLGTLTAGLVLGAGALRLWEDYLAGDPSAPSGTICANDCPPELVSTVASGARLTLPPGTTVQAYAAPRGADEGFTARLLLPRGSASPVLGSDAEETYSTHPDGYEGDEDAIRRFARLADGLFVPVQHISDAAAEDPAEVALRLIGTPDMWGGNSRLGID